MWFFAPEKKDDKELKQALVRMNEQIKAAGGQFTFDFKIDDDGWVAKCKEFEGIVTGGENKNPSQEEIMSSLIDAVKTAFHIPITKLKFEKGDFPTIRMPKIRIVNDFQFV